LFKTIGKDLVKKVKKIGPWWHRTPKASKNRQ
jgi:hypothetical protein